MSNDINNITSLEVLFDELKLDKRKNLFGIKDKEIPENILSIFKKLEYVKAVAFYRFNQDDFTFDKILTKPLNSDIYLDEYFDELVDIGIIGRTLQSLESEIYPELELNNQENIVIAPLSDELNANGLVLILLSKHWGDKSKLYLKFTNIIANHFSNIFSLYQKNLKINELENDFEKKLSEKLKAHIETENELNTFLDALQSGVIVYSNKTGKIFRANPVALTLTGYTNSEILQTTIDKIVDTSNSIENEHYETYLICKDNSKIPILRKSKLVNINDSKFMVDSFLDITDIKNANDTLMNLNNILEEKVNKRTIELQKTIEKLNKEMSDRMVAQYNASKERSLNQMKSKFISSVSHEFRTPLTIIRTSSDLLYRYSDKLSEEDKDKYLKRIIQTIDYLSLVLQNILYLQDIDESETSASSVEFQINEVIKDLINKFKQVSNKPLNIHTEFSSKNIIMYQNKGLINKIIENLLQNAINYGNDKDINIKVIEDDDIVAIEINDKGIGIFEDEIDKIYELFYRGKNVNNIPGIGLGLSIVKHSLSIINGMISVKSKVNEGTKVEIIIPKFFSN